VFLIDLYSHEFCANCTQQFLIDPDKSEINLECLDHINPFSGGDHCKYLSAQKAKRVY